MADSDTLTRAEIALAVALTEAAAVAVGRVCAEQGRPHPTAEQARELVRAAEDIVIGLVLRMREPGPRVTAKVLAVMVRGAALGAVDLVLGVLPSEAETVN